MFVYINYTQYIHLSKYIIITSYNIGIIIELEAHIRPVLDLYKLNIPKYGYIYYRA